MHEMGLATTEDPLCADKTRTNGVDEMESDYCKAMGGDITKAPAWYALTGTAYDNTAQGNDGTVKRGKVTLKDDAGL